MKRSRSKRPSPPAAAPKPPASAPLSHSRRWLFRLAAMLLVPVLFLATLEAGLRLAGFGHPMSFFLPLKIAGQDSFVENSRFGWRFFGPDMARAPFPLAFPKLKPADTIRIFVFGESAALGDPQPEFGFSRILAALLEGRYPDKKFEVINTAMTAINSHVILPIARDCAGKDGDFWVVYMGNNEVVGPYGSGTVFGAQAANLNLIRAGLAFKATRIGQLMGDLARRAQKPAVSQSEWGGMSMFQQNQVRQDDPRMAAVYQSFAANLNDLIDLGLDSGAQVLVSTVPSNLKDCGPFASEHHPGISPAVLTQWDNDYQNAIKAQREGRLAEAIAAWHSAFQIDDTYAEAHFRCGQCLLALQQDQEAAHQMILARDLDTLRFRADSRINDLIRRAATNDARKGVELVDSEAIMTANSPHGLVGEEFLYEHVHLNYEGNYLVARAFAEQIGRAMGTDDRHPWPTPAECASRLGWNDYSRRAAELDILGRLGKPPFAGQVGHEEQSDRLLQQIQLLQTATQPDYVQETTVRAHNAATARPTDWVLWNNLALLQQQLGNLPDAIESWQHVVRLLPQNTGAWENLGVALAQAKRNDEAASAFQQSIRLAPESVASRNSLAELYASEDRPVDAAREFQEVLRLKPYWGPAHLGLGKTLEALGRTQEAQVEFAAALQNRISSPASFNTLAQFAFSRGWYGAAVTNFADALRLDPTDPGTQVNLGLALVKVGRGEEAKAHYAEALRLQPNFAEAHFCLGLELGGEGDDAGAQAQFAEAVRLKPEFIEARLNLGIALSNQHQDLPALDQFNAVLHLDPKNPTALQRIQMLDANSPPAPPVP